MNSTLKNKFIQGKQELLLVSLNNFYKNESNKINLMNILNGEEKISLRIIDWFVTNYAKKYNINYSLKIKISSPKRSTIKKGLKFSKKDMDKYTNFRQINVFLSYKEQLRAYSKKQFDPFCRRNRINFYFNESEFITTTVGQLNFFRWSIQNNIIKYIMEHYKEIEVDMNNNTRKKNINELEIVSKTHKKLSDNVVGEDVGEVVGEDVGEVVGEDVGEVVTELELNNEELDKVDLDCLDLKNSKLEKTMRKKLRKKRQPLSVAATKNMNKNSYHVLLNFD
jgi:hypothetical protein